MIEDEERVLVKWVGGDRTPSCMDEVGSCANPTHRPHPSSPGAVWFPLYLHFACNIYQAMKSCSYLANIGFERSCPVWGLVPSPSSAGWLNVRESGN